MRWTCHLPNQISMRSCLQVIPLFLQVIFVIARAIALAMTCYTIFQPVTKNRQGLDSHGSGVLFKPTRGHFVTLLLGMNCPASIHKPEPVPVKSALFSLFVIPIA